MKIISNSDFRTKFNSVLVMAVFISNSLAFIASRKAEFVVPEEPSSIEKSKQKRLLLIFLMI